MSEPMTTEYFLLFFLFTLVLCFRLLGWTKLERLSAQVSLVGNGLLLGSIWFSSGHVPVFNLFESFLLTTFILGVLVLVFTKEGLSRLCTRTWIWAEVILLFGILLFYPKTHAPERFYDKDLYVVLFHVGRATALSAMLLASGFYAEFLRTFREPSLLEDSLHMGRNFLVLGAILFLISEYAGILWCLNGWGDFWRWNYGFLSSTFIMLYLMLVFHVPGKSPVSQRVTSITGAMNSLVFLGITVSRSLP
jgi:hypothetical protein